MNTIQLEQALSSDRFLSRYSTKVLPLDKLLEHKFTTSSAVIFNYDISSLPGSHWVALFVCEKGKVEYFDSYGVKPLTENLSKKINSISSSLPKFNLVSFQGNSFVCGQYCLLFLLLRARGNSFKFIQNLFLKCNNQHERDHIINLFINEIFGFSFSVHNMK